MSGIGLGTNFSPKSPVPIEDRLILNAEERLNMLDSIMPDKYFCIGKEDGAIYLYDKSNSVDATNGKYRILQTGEGGTKWTVSEYQDYWDNLEINPTTPIPTP